MQNKGIVKFIALALVLICCFYLSFSVVTQHYEDKAAAMGKDAGKEYLDSLMNEKVYVGYTLKQCREMEIGLGLDLQGGINVVLEVSVPAIVDMLAEGNANDPIYKQAVEAAKKEGGDSQENYINLFAKHFKELSNGKPLASVFATQKMKGQVSTQSTDDEVIAAIELNVQSAIDNSYNVVQNRIDKFGVAQPNIQKLEGGSGRIMVEMPGVKDQERVRKLLQGSANLEFWETYNSEDIYGYFVQLNQRLATEISNTEAEKAETAAADEKEVAEEKAVEEKADSLQDGLAQAIAAEGNNKPATAAEKEAAKKLNPLFYMFQPVPQGSLSVVGYAHADDRGKIDTLLTSDIAKQIFPTDVRFYWEAKPYDVKANVYTLHAIRVTDPSGKAPLEGNVITSAKDGFDQYNKPEVSMTMNSEGSRAWAQLTKQNIGKAIAIVLDNTVYSAPRVNGEITGGSSQISGNFTIEDTKDLANTLNSGKMPAPANIISAEQVGPTLGAQSIEQGVWSFVVALVLLMIYMVVLYNWIPGMLANCALALNFFFILGILTSFQSALTMSGIAGIVLTLGMAVDANVLIYERIKEELRSGLNVKEALKKGYANALSAIFDSNLTSIITAVILYKFGTGPIQGFALTLGIGIVCSFFTAVYLTRLVYEHQLNKDKWLGLTFTTKISSKFLRDTNFNFMGSYKKSFIIWGVLAVVFAGFFAIRGLSKSIDFTGGRNYVLQLEQVVQPEQVRAALAGAFVEEVDGSQREANTTVLALGTEGTRIRVSTNYMIDSTDPTIDDKCETILFNALSKAGFVTQSDVDTFKNPDLREGGSIISSSKVGPSMAESITNGAIISVIFALIAIFVYILIRFRNVAFSVGSTVALAFDTLFVIGLYSALWGVLPMSLEVDQTFIGAILTVIGYSINDKVIVFDRMRENMALYPNRSRWELFNTSLNQVLARTINTSSTTLLVLLCILIFGGDSIRSFSFAMCLGVVFGTLSSIFVATPIAYFTLSKSEKKENVEK